MVAARVGILFAGGLGPVLYNSKDNLLEGFSYMGLVFGAAMTITGLITFYLTRNVPRIEAVSHSINLRAEMAALWANLPFRILFFWLPVSEYRHR